MSGEKTLNRVLLVEADKLYGLCFSGYQYRDQLIPQEFASMTQSFVLLLTLMGAARSVPLPSEWMPQTFAGAIGVAGFFALLAYSIDLHANSTCKGKLRDMMFQIELGKPLVHRHDHLNPRDDVAAYWHFIAHRNLTLLENIAWGVEWSRVVTMRGIKWLWWRQFGGTEPGERPPIHVSATHWFRGATYVYICVWLLLAYWLVTLPPFPLIVK